MLGITIILASLLGFLFIVLTMKVIKQRQISEVSLSDGGDVTMLRRIRGQGNFVEYVPFFLILFGLAEYHGAHPYFLIAVAIAFLSARIMHGYALSFTDKSTKARFYGTLITGICFIVICIVDLLLGLGIAPLFLLK